MQNTQLNKFQKQIGLYLSTSLIGPWKRRCLGLISLLIGYYLGSNLTAYFLEKSGQRAVVVLFMVLIIEIIIRLRNSIKSYPWPLLWLSIDNIRIGSVYAVVLEAFKLGS